MFWLATHPVVRPSTVIWMHLPRPKRPPKNNLQPHATIMRWRIATMLEQIKQVSLTYVTQAVSCGWCWGSSGLLILPNLILAASPIRSANDAAPSMLFDLGMPILFLRAISGRARSKCTPPTPVHG